MKSLAGYRERELGRTRIPPFVKRDIENELYCQKDVRFHTGCVNSVEFSNDENYLASGGDDCRVVIWRVGQLICDRAPKPAGVMTGTHSMNVFATQFSLGMEWLYSGGRAGILMKHDVETCCTLVVDGGGTNYDDSINRIHQCPTDNNLISVVKDAMVDLWDSRCLEKSRICGGESCSFEAYYTGDFNPSNPNLFLVCSLKHGPVVFDLRKRDKPILTNDNFFGPRFDPEDCFHCTYWNPSGFGFGALASGGFPSFYDLSTKTRIELLDQNYVNSKTNKSMTFMDDYTMCTGSEDNGIFIWRIPELLFTEKKPSENSEYISVPKADRILRGHRSIPNELRYSHVNKIMVTSGVENMIKVWSRVRIPYSYDKPYIRRTRDEYKSVEEEREREKRERLEYETELGEEMEGRATWHDVFGGDDTTAECRHVCEAFDDVVGSVIRDNTLRRIFNLSQYGNEEDEEDMQWDNYFLSDEEDSDEEDDF